MIESWWAAHEFEFVFWGGVTVLGAAVWFAESISDAWRERKQKKKDGLL
jgi:hypothetical protein